MSTKFKYLSGELLEFLDQFCLGMYLDGSCYEFAIALHRGLGWPMVGVITGEPAERIVRHAVLRQPNGKLYDARGEIESEEELVAPFRIGRAYRLQDVSEDDLRAVRPVSEPNIEHARRMAEARFPLLPWLTSQQKRYQAFADGLEELSRRTGVWIRSPVPTCPPVLADSGDDEEGYTLRQTAEGFGYTIDRRFIDDVYDG